MRFHFIASNNFELDYLNSVDKFVQHFPDFQSVLLKDENELILLLERMGMNDVKVIKLDVPVYHKYWDLSNFKFPVFSQNEYDQLYQTWIEKSKREDNMNEYGSLIFLNGLSKKWNQLNCRLVISEQ